METERMKYLHKDRYSWAIIIGVVGLLIAMTDFLPGHKTNRYAGGVMIVMAALYFSYNLLTNPRIKEKEKLITQLDPGSIKILTENEKDSFRAVTNVNEMDSLDGVCINGKVFKLVDGGDYYVTDSLDIQSAGFGTSIISTLRKALSNYKSEPKWQCQ